MGELGELVPRTVGRIDLFLHAKNGDHWFGSSDDGVYRQHAGSLTHFTSAHGLSDDRISFLAEDTTGNILIATAGGAYRFDGTEFVPFRP